METSKEIRELLLTADATNIELAVILAGKSEVADTLEEAVGHPFMFHLKMLLYQEKYEMLAKEMKYYLKIK